MEILAIVILCGLCLFLAVRAGVAERSLRSAARQLRSAMEGGGASRLKLEAPNRAAEELMDAINRLLELRQADEAEWRGREQALRRQIANVSHDLRTPLTSILGYLQLLEEEGLSEAERREYLAVVRGRSKALQELITGFYDLSRLEGGEFPLVRERVEPAKVLSQLLASFYGDFEEAGFRVEVALEEGTILADPGGVLRVYTNLIRNALEHGRDTLEVRLFRAGDKMVTRFANGCTGLTAEDLPHLFDRFYTADKTRTGRSTGLGLAIVRTLVRQMGGEAAAELEGERFAITLSWPVARNLPEGFSH